VFPALGFLAAIAMLGLAGPSISLGAHGDTRTVKGTARTDSALTPGGLETLFVKGLPKRLPFQIPVGPVPSSPTCQGDFVCEPSIARRPAGGRPFRTSGRGRVTVTFVMPTTYTRHRLGSSAQGTLAFQPGELVQVQANGFTIDKKVQTVGIAVTIAPVSLP